MKQNKGKMSIISIITIIIMIVLICMLVIFIINKDSKLHDDKDDNEISNNMVEKVDNEINNNIVENNENSYNNTNYIFTKEEFPKEDGATAMRPLALEIAKDTIGMTNDEAEDFIVHNTTAKAYENLINKKADIIFASEPSDNILNNAKNAGVEFEMVGIGKDGFVFVVNKDNAIESLTIEQIQKIYTGEITNWKDVGGKDLKIVAFQREENSGSQNLMEKMVMKGLKMAKVPNDLCYTSMEGLVDAVASYSNSDSSIGYSIYLYAKEQYVRDNIKFVSINGVYPTDETIADGTYPLSKIVYAIFRKDEPENSNVRKLVNYLLTPEGQEIVEKGGYTKIK